jgi:hypothetical protein
MQQQLNLRRPKVNRMCSLMDQVRSIAHMMTAVACGDLTQKIEIQVEGALKGMVNFAS